MGSARGSRSARESGGEKKKDKKRKEKGKKKAQDDEDDDDLGFLGNCLHFFASVPRKPRSAYFLNLSLTLFHFNAIFIRGEKLFI